MRTLTRAEARAILREEAATRGLLKQPDRKRYSDWIKWEPFPRQRETIEDNTPNLLFGGAVGSAKSVTAVMKALRWVHVPGYRACLIREHVTDFEESGSMLDVAHQLLAGTDARYVGGRKMTYTFPSGAQIQFRGLSSKAALRRLWGGSWSLIIIDEGQNVKPELKRKLLTRNRAPDTVTAVVPLQFCETANPGGAYNDDLVERYIKTDSTRHKYIRFRLFDNPHIDHDEYLAQMAGMNAAEREQLIEGNFEFVLTGKYCEADWFRVVAPLDWPRFGRYVRAWDPCWTDDESNDEAGSVLMAQNGNDIYVAHAQERRLHITELDKAIIEQAQVDPEGTVTVIEKSSLSIAAIKYLTDTGLWVESELQDAERNLVKVMGENAKDGKKRRLIIVVPQVGSKLERASLHLSELRAGQFHIRAGAWNATYIKRHVRFTNTDADIDGVIDATSNGRRALMVIPTPIKELDGLIIPGTRSALRQTGTR